MNLTKLAWRNLWRRKRRTLITALSIAFGVMLAVTATGIGDYSYSNMIDSSAHMGYGHITVAQQGYLQNPALDNKLRSADSVRKQVLGLPEVISGYERIFGQAMFASANKTVGGAFIGINPSQENSKHNVLIRSIVEGALFDNPHSGQVVVGRKLATQLKLKIGNKLVYTTTDRHGEIVSEIARVGAIFETGVKEVDGSLVLLPIDSIRKTLNYQPNEASVVAVVIADQRQAQKVQEKIKQRIDTSGREVLTWQETQPDIAGFVALDRSSNYITQFLVGLLIAAGILNTLLMSVLERTREFGIMMAIGLTPRSLFKLVVIESLWMAILGLALGVLITAPWFYYLFHVGIDFSNTIGDDYSAGGVLIDPIMKIRLYRESAIGILLGVFGLSLISGIYPAWRAGRIPPVESLKVM